MTTVSIIGSGNTATATATAIGTRATKHGVTISRPSGYLTGRAIWAGRTINLLYRRSQW
jgi:hypothetical protein